MVIEIGKIINNQIISAVRPQHIKEQKQNEVRSLIKRRSDIWRLKHDLGYIELEKPIRHGWYKEIVILRKVERYRNKEAILEIFEKIEKAYWGRTKEEADKNWFHHVSRNYIYRDFPTLSKRQFNKLSFKAQRMCTPYKFRNYKKWRTRFYIRIPKNAYRIKYSRAYITHRRRIDPNLESELDYIEYRLNRKGYYNVYEAFNPWKSYWDYEQREKQRLKTKRHLRELKKHNLDDVINENVIWD